MEVWQIIFLSNWVLCRFHVNLPGCIRNCLVLSLTRKRGSKNSSFTWSSIQHVYGIKTHIHIWVRDFRLDHITPSGSRYCSTTNGPVNTWSQHHAVLHGGSGIGLDLHPSGPPGIQWQPRRFWGFPRLKMSLRHIISWWWLESWERMSIDTPSVLFTVTTLLLTVTTSQESMCCQEGIGTGTTVTADQLISKNNQG